MELPGPEWRTPQFRHDVDRPTLIEEARIKERQGQKLARVWAWARAQQDQQQTQQHHYHHQNQQLQHQKKQQAQAQQQQNQEEEDIEEDRLSQDGNTSNSDTASEYEHSSEISSEQSSDSEISEEEEVTEPPQKRQRKDSMRTLLKDVKKQLADSEEHLQAKDKQLEETKAEKTKQERAFKLHLEQAMLELKKVKKQLADREEHLQAKDKQLEETKANLEQAMLELEEVEQQLADREEHLRAKDEELEETKEQAQQTQEDLLCVVCKGLFIEPVILNCAHSFCTFCIRKSREVKNECPLCRKSVQYQTRNLGLEKCMEPIVHRLSPDEKATRHREITERANQDETRETPDRIEVSPAQDMLSPSQDVLYLHASPMDGVYSNSPYINSPAYSNIPTPQSVSSTASENEEPSRSW